MYIGIFVQVWMHLRMGQIEQQTLIFWSPGEITSIYLVILFSKNVVIDGSKIEMEKAHSLNFYNDIFSMSNYRFLARLVDFSTVIF